MAKRYGFTSLEFHDEVRSEDRKNLKDLLFDIDLPINSMNVRMGETFGCAAIPELADRAREDIAEAGDIAEDIGASALHILAGIRRFGYLFRHPKICVRTRSAHHTHRACLSRTTGRVFLA